MGFHPQLEALMVTLATLITFAACIFVIGIPVKISLLITAYVFVAGLFFGRHFAKAVIGFFS
jgi:hypothetical protein